MATATFVKTSLVDNSDQTKSIAVIDVDGNEVQVEFWFSLINSLGKEDTKTCLCAEALIRTGNFIDAHELLTPIATGSITKDENGNKVDNRNWAKNWLDAYPIPTQQTVNEIDPLA